MTRAKLARVRVLEEKTGGALEVWAEVEDRPGLFRQVFPASGEEKTRADLEARKVGRLVRVEYGEEKRGRT